MCCMTPGQRRRRVRWREHQSDAPSKPRLRAHADTGLSVFVVRVSIYPSIYLSNDQYIHLSIDLSIYLSIYLSINMNPSIASEYICSQYIHPWYWPRGAQHGQRQRRVRRGEDQPHAPREPRLYTRPLILISLHICFTNRCWCGTHELSAHKCVISPYMCY